ncbi:DinB family protein [Salipaludibacillus agaradhaerens]|uniref:DinB family protein n=1 Tax=Salipaludibacillus agaradhaerens TaxID=76935 RepID=A0A9Q4G070_SALAG|nr:DinB family protein [Salipaludibacillus agaradhaerens]MCR6097504.1 DinB family protein [Salipaludibacillus agaradhaerens]MCR6113012.1 DinB family protein [Salipaludibacillus agaradhaerens]
MSQPYDSLIEQLLANANDRSWYLSFQEAVEGLTEKEAFWKPSSHCHSIAEIVQHLIFWNDTWQKRYVNKDVTTVPSLENNKDTFHVRAEYHFNELKEQLLISLLRWPSLLSQKQLMEKVERFPVHAEWWSLIGNMSSHNAYHIGQIVYIRKLQRST